MPGDAARALRCDECGALSSELASRCTACDSDQVRTVYLVSRDPQGNPLSVGEVEDMNTYDPDTEGYFWDRFPEHLN